MIVHFCGFSFTTIYFSLSTGGITFKIFLLAYLLSTSVFIYLYMHGFRKVDRRIETDVKGKMGGLEVIVVPDYLYTITLTLFTALHALL